MKKQKQINNIEKITVLFGYGLFVLFLISLVQTVIFPFSSILFHPTAKHFYAAIVIVSLIAGAVLPTLLSYFIGDISTRSKSKLVHHFNGILFGIAAFWISYSVHYFGADVTTWSRSIISEPWVLPVNIAWQIAVPVIIMTIIASAYAHQKKKNSLHEYKPYQLVLGGSILFTAIYTLASTQDPSGQFMAALLIVGIPIVLTAISYATLLKSSLSQSTRLTLSAVSMSISFITTYIAFMSLSYTEIAYNDFMFISLIAGPVVMAAYLLLIRRGL